jgi:uncharacterized RDD family membrane protein YckC
MTTPATPPVPDLNEVPRFTLGGYGGNEDELVGVGFWPRAGARMMDTLVHMGVSFCSGFLFVLIYVIASGGHPDRAVLARLQRTDVIGILFALLGSISYHSVCEGLHGSTFGKRVLSMVVVKEDGTPCGFGPAIIRSFAYFIDALFFGLIGYFAMQDNPKEQRHGDKWAHTVVSKRALIASQNLRGTGRFVVVLLLASMADAMFIMTGFLVKVMA